MQAALAHRESPFRSEGSFKPMDGSEARLLRGRPERRRHGTGTMVPWSARRSRGAVGSRHALLRNFPNMGNLGMRILVHM